MFVWIVVTVGTHRHRHPAAGVRPAAGGWILCRAALHLLEESVRYSHDRRNRRKIKWCCRSYHDRNPAGEFPPCQKCRASGDIIGRRIQICRQCIDRLQRVCENPHANYRQCSNICGDIPCCGLTVREEVGRGKTQLFNLISDFIYLNGSIGPVDINISVDQQSILIHRSNRDFERFFRAKLCR